MVHGAELLIAIDQLCLQRLHLVAQCLCRAARQLENSLTVNPSEAEVDSVGSLYGVGCRVQGAGGRGQGSACRVQV